MIPLSLVVCTLLALAMGTNVLQCPGKSIENLNENVKLTPCKRSPCRLKKGTNTHISINFVPENDMEDVTNHVTADVFGVMVPFIGVDGNSVCDKLQTESGEKASCPLKAGTKYVYTDQFLVQNFYPLIDVKVHWALREGTNDIMCFEMPAKIVK
ncbi:ecdysteroid-regulated 16 kDa protein-like [Epargyreus clarus]|uniref:ecdysteroid-regulated 16 kDa protein-like n=1 Tax=Epargyreus clarus TaxID=520877 RepID=UPI003C303B9F